MTPRGSSVGLALAAAAITLAAGCSSGTSRAGSSALLASRTGTPSVSGSATTAAAVPTMTISGFAFSALTVKPGVLVMVNNQDGVSHTVKVNGTTVDVTVPARGTATFTTPAKAGTYPLTCDFHPNMHGTLTVTVTG